MPFSICNQYSYIAEKVSEIPSNTEELVLLIDFLKKSSDVTVFKLRRQLRDAIERLEFLMDYADLPRKPDAICVCMGVCVYQIFREKESQGGESSVLPLNVNTGERL